MNILLVSGGNINKELLLKTVKETVDPYIIGVDRGTIYLLENNIRPDIAIGDFDSVDSNERQVIDKFLEKEVLNPIKDDTDTEHALKYALNMKPEKIIMLGCSGTRLDHTLSCIGLLKTAYDSGVEAFMIDEHNRIRVDKGTIILTAKDLYGKYISLLPYGEKAEGITMHGFKYEVDDLVLEADVSRGISNELVRDVGMITSKDYIIIVESSD